MASLYKKVISGRPYWYLREMGWVDGKPKMICERYVGTAAEVEALLDAREERMLPERTRHLDFGAVAAAWGLLADLGMAAIIDQETGPGPSGLPLSPGTYLALAALNRAVDPCSKRGFADCRDLLALPASARSVVNAGRFGGLTACDTRRAVYGTERRAILTHSPELRQHQARGFDGTTLAKAGRKLDELAATLARGKTRRARAKVEAEIGKITHDPWVRRVVTWQLAGEQPKDFRLAWDAGQAARAALEEEIFGKHVLITDHDDWPAAEVIAAYRSQSEAEFSFRQMKDPRVVSFSPMFHWTEHNIRVHTFTCVLALQIAHLLRLQAERAGLHISVRELLAQLAGIGETVLIYPAERGRPKARRMLTETSAAQDKLIQIFQLNRHAPAVRS